MVVMLAGTAPAAAQPVLPDSGLAALVATRPAPHGRRRGPAGARGGPARTRRRARGSERETARRDREREREADAYAEGQDALDEARYDRAVSFFSRVAEMKGPRADAALYWKSYAQNRLGQRAEALTTIADLTKTYPKSRYLKQANALEVEVRRDAGQPVRPQDQTDEDMKLMALQALQHHAPDEAIPMLEKVLEGTASPRVKRQALFVLAQSDSPKARDLLRNYARGGSDAGAAEPGDSVPRGAGRAGEPRRAGRCLRRHDRRRCEAAHPARVHGRRRQGAALGRGAERAERRDSRRGGPAARRDGGDEQLWQLYQKETSPEVKKQVLQAMFVGGNATRLIDLARTESDPELRRLAVRNLGLMGSKNTADALLQIYASDTTPAIRKAVVEALFLQQNAPRSSPWRGRNRTPRSRRTSSSGCRTCGTRPPPTTCWSCSASRSASCPAPARSAPAHSPSPSLPRRLARPPPRCRRSADGPVQTRPAGADFAAGFRALVDAQTDAAWFGYTVPAVDPERVMCCFDSGTWISGSIVTADGAACCGACRLERPAEGTSMTRTPAPSTGVVRLERSPLMAVLFRVVNRRVDIVRVFSQDCQLDAGGRAVTWIEGVRPADSVALLESLVDGGDDRRDRAGESAISAIALHGDPAADAALARLVAPGQPDAIRRRVPFWLGNARGRAGLDLLTRLVREDASPDVRKKAVFGISQSREPAAIDVLIDAARTNPSASVRGEAIFWLAQKAGRKAAGAITERIEQDPDTAVKKQAVFALSQLPKDEGIPLLITVARTHSNPAVRKQAFFWLGQSKDPRALDFLAAVLKVTGASS